MITINELIEKQKEFDSKHKSSFNWNEKITDKNINILEFLLLSMVGEFGETANIIKKVIRGDKTLNEVREDLSEEVIDILIYVLKLAYQLDIDIEKVYNQKMIKNKKRFEKYERDNDEKDL